MAAAPSDVMPPELIALHPELRSLTSASEAALLSAIAGSGAGQRQAAQAEFYSRHVGYVYAALLKQPARLRRVIGVSAEDVVQDTFNRAFQRAHTFDAAGISDPDHLRRRTRAWLGRIANNLLIDALRKSSEVADSPTLELMESAVDPDRQPESRRSDPGAHSTARPPHPRTPTQRMHAAFERLSDREQDVLRVSAMYYRAGDHQRLPNAAAHDLATRWGTSNENVRAIRSRALKKLKAALAELARDEAEATGGAVRRLENP